MMHADACCLLLGALIQVIMFPVAYIGISCLLHTDCLLDCAATFQMRLPPPLRQHEIKACPSFQGPLMEMKSGSQSVSEVHAWTLKGPLHSPIV
jgi:hypothetical protein